MPMTNPTTDRLAEVLASKATWFRFHQSTGEFTGEYCSVKPHDDNGMVPMVSVEAAADLLQSQQAEIERLREALIQSKQGWDNVLEFRLIPDQHRTTASELSSNIEAALSPQPGKDTAHD